MKFWSAVTGWLSGFLGGRERAHVIVLLALALGLDGADLGAVGSMSTILEHHFSVTKMQIGLLISVSKGIGIFSTLFFGSFVDRTRRTRLLAVIVVLWGITALISGAATSYTFLLMTRLALGAVSAATIPCTASLVGDYFPGNERGKIYGYILTGEIIGTGLGFIVAGELAELWWRLGFWVLLIPSFPLAWFIYRLPEPKRGGKSHLKAEHGQTEEDGENRLITRMIKEAGVRPRERLIPPDDPAKKSVWWAIKFVLSIPTNTVLVIGSALGYAFFSVLRTFGVQYAQSEFHLAHSDAVGMLGLLGIGVLAGIWLGGRLGDGLLARGYLNARVWVATAFFWLSVLFFFPGFFFRILWLSVAFFICSALALGGVNPPLDSARLDIMHPELRGRAEAVRTIFRNLGEAITPVGFGWLVSQLSGKSGGGLRDGFLLMLIPLAMAGAVALISWRTYAADAAAAVAYRERTMKNGMRPS